MSSRVDTIALTIANCRFISPPDADFLVVTIKEHPGSWNAYVIRTVNGHRGLFLHAAGLTPETAVSELHAKSAEIARGHITLNGYALVRRSDKKRSSKASSDQDNPALSESSLTVDVIDLSASSDCESLSDDETVSIASRAGDQQTKQKSHKSHKRKEGGKGGSDARRSRSRSRSRSTTRSVSRSSASQSRSRSRSRSSSTSSEYRQVYGPPRPQPMNSMRPFNNPPPPPPPGYTNWPPHMREMPGPPRTNNNPHHHHHHPGAARPPPPPASSGPIPTLTPTHPAMTVPPPSPSNGGGGPQQQPRPQQRLHDVLIHIHLQGRGDAKVLKRLPGPTQSALKSAALSHVRHNPQAFGGANPQDHHALKISPLGSPGSVHLSAVLRGVSVGGPGGGEQIDLQGYQGENLGALVQELVQAHRHAPSRAGGGGGGLLPRFEVEVTFGPTPEQHHHQHHHHPHPGFGVPPKGPARGTMGQVVNEC
ncbi:hypothetical protein GE09DRAFT_1217928 [Coniochaeta sp. 2T2.1]|nr:hypothetical protein GE09DRAFT_1217928 [Coniochaeta sp. 2T2.1]